MQSVKSLTNLQIELLKIFSYPLKEEQVKDIKAILSQYFSEQATSEMDKLWDDRGWSNETMKNWAKEHRETEAKP